MLALSESVSTRVVRDPGWPSALNKAALQKLEWPRNAIGRERLAREGAVLFIDQSFWGLPVEAIWTDQTWKQPLGSVRGPGGGQAGAPWCLALSPRGVASRMLAEQGGSQTSGPALGRAHSLSPGAVETGRALGLQEDLRPIPCDTVSTSRLAQGRGVSAA